MSVLSLTELEIWLLEPVQARPDARDLFAIVLADRLNADLVALCVGRIDEAEVRRRFQGYVTRIWASEPRQCWN